MINVLITGGSGFIAGAVKKRLEQFPDRYRVETVSLRGDAWKARGFAGWDCVVHTAGIAHVKQDYELVAAYFRVNRDLALEAARRAKADGVNHFIYLSSMSVYGDALPAGVRRRIDGRTPPAPTNAYGQSKLEAEAGLRRLADADFAVAALRPPMVYGRGCKGNYNALRKLALRLPVFPRFENERSVLYVENLAECVRLIIDGRLRGLFFPQDAQTVSTAALAGAIVRAHGRKLPLLRCLNPVVRLLGRSGMGRRAFGDMAYDPAISARPEGYRVCDFETSILKTEIE